MIEGRSQLYIRLCLLLVCLCGCGPVRRAVRLPVDGEVDRSLGPGLSNVQLMVEPEDGWRPLVRLVNSASDRIFVTAYILSDRRVERALERAATEGVEVCVLLDHHPYGLGAQPAGMADRLHAAGVRVRWSRPGLVFTHAKYLVFDDRVAVISTANLSRSAFSKNREFLVVDRNVSDLFAISSLFRADWNRSRARVLDPNLVIAPANARSKLTRLIQSARRSIEIYAEEIADPSLEAIIGKMARGGVRARVLVPASAARAGLDALRRYGVNVGTLASPYAHAKVVIIDDREAFVGSENISTTSLDRNRELGLLVRGHTVHRMRSIFDADWGRALHLQ